MIDKQVTDRMENLIDEEARLAFQQYKREAFLKAEAIVGNEITDKDALNSLIRGAYEKGIRSDRLGELMAQAQK